MATRTPQQEYDEAERELIGAAVSQTEDEIANSAFDKDPPDDSDDTSLEELDDDEFPDDDETDDDDAEIEASGDDGEEEPEPEPERQQGRIPPARLKEEADARRAAEAEAAATRAEMAALRAEMQAQRQPRQQAPEPPPKPDLFADPEGWAKAQRDAIREELETTRFNQSLAEAHQEHGDKFAAAFNALRATGDQSTFNRIRGSYNPGRELMRWHDQQTLMQEVRDPAAYRERIRQELLNDPEVRQQLVGELRGQATPRVKLPPSLNSARGGGSHQSKDGAMPRRSQVSKSTEQDIFDSAFE